jgi:hypothetical protein
VATLKISVAVALLYLLVFPAPQSTVLTKTTALTKTTKLGLTIPTLNPGLTFGQDILYAGTGACTSGGTTCTIPAGGSSQCIAEVPECTLPTAAGAEWLAFLYSTNNVPISGVSDSDSGSWTSSGCHTYNSTLALNADVWYSNDRAAESTPPSITVTTGTGATDMQVTFMTVNPQSGYAAEFDNCAGTSNATCTTTCTGASPTVTATDAIVQFAQTNNSSFPQFNLWSSPYITDYAGNGFCFNCTSGTAPTIAMGTGTGGVFLAVAIKSNVGTFTSSQPSTISLANYSALVSGSTEDCTPGCPALTVPSTSTGHALVLVEADWSAGTVKFSSITDNQGETWTKPGGCYAFNNYPGDGGNLNCAYVLSATAGVTSVTPTMTASSSDTGFAWFELACSGGSWSEDATNGTSNSASNIPPGQALTLTGSNDAIVQAINATEGAGSVTGYPMPLVPGGPGTNPTFIYAASETPPNYQASAVVLMNTSNGAAPTWVYPGLDEDTAVVALALTCP